jgi:secondary thiamine-phosphate synthase enzyme
MKQVQEMLSIETFGQGLTEITREIDNWVQRNDIFTGLLTIYIRHTSASLVVQENADPSVVKDLEAFFKKIAPEDTALYNHTAEGPDDMPAHIKGSLTETSISIPVDDNCMVLGTWQGIFLFEHRTRPHVREVVLHMIGV